MNKCVVGLLILMAVNSHAQGIRLYDKVTINDGEQSVMSQFAVVIPDINSGKTHKQSALNLSSIIVPQSFLVDGRLDRQEVDKLLTNSGILEKSILGASATAVVTKQRYRLPAETLIAKAASCLEAQFDRAVSVSSVNVNKVTDLSVDVDNPEIRCDKNSVEIGHSASVVFVDVFTARKQETVPVWFRVKTKTIALLAKDAYKAGQVLSLKDFTRQETYVENVDTLEYLDQELHSEFLARKDIRVGQPLRRSDIGAIPDVNKGDLVNVMVESGSLKLTIHTKALESGFIGDVVRIAPLGSQGTLHGTVIGSRSVRVD